jgi:cytochrome c-type biogenesis protein CcmH/NrfG
MATLVRWFVALAIVALIVPEFQRYGSERALYTFTAATQQATSAHTPQADRLLREISGDAESLRTFPGDWRPLQLAGRASLSVHNPRRALTLFGRALRDGERPEIDYDTGLAFLSSNDAPSADAAFLRASWINPAIAEMLARRGLHRYTRLIAALARSLEAGRLTAAELPPAPVPPDS